MGTPRRQLGQDCVRPVLSFSQEAPGGGLETPNAGPTPGGLTQNLTGFRLLPPFFFERRFDLVIPLSLPSAGITVGSYRAQLHQCLLKDLLNDSHM